MIFCSSAYDSDIDEETKSLLENEDLVKMEVEKVMEANKRLEKFYEGTDVNNQINSFLSMVIKINYLIFRATSCNGKIRRRINGRIS